MTTRYFRSGRTGWVIKDPHSDSIRDIPLVPVVVIDPNNDAEVEALADAFERTYCGMTPAARMATALLSLITPPRPPEPTELGTVITDRHGHKWVRADEHRPAWFAPRLDYWSSYDEIELP